MAHKHKAAFPHDHLGGRVTPSLGMTMREYYAGIILASMCAQSYPIKFEERPKKAIELADALIEALNQ